MNKTANENKFLAEIYPCPVGAFVEHSQFGRGVVKQANWSKRVVDFEYYYTRLASDLSTDVLAELGFESSKTVALTEIKLQERTVLASDLMFICEAEDTYKRWSSVGRL